MLNRNRLYIILLIACLAGYGWLFGLMPSHVAQEESTRVCFFRNITGMACPSCGATRSVAALTRGDFAEAILINPIGYIIAMILVFAPLWILWDVIRRRQTFFLFYKQAELKLKNPRIAIPLALLVLVNWIWNISKGL